MRLSSSLMPGAAIRRWGCCGRPPRWCSPAGAPCVRPCAGPRTPAGWSPHARGGGRCRGCRCRPAAARRRGCPRSCRTGVRGHWDGRWACFCHDSASVGVACRAGRRLGCRWASRRGGIGLRRESLPVSAVMVRARARRCGPTCRSGRAGNTAWRGARRRGAPPRSRRSSANTAGTRAPRPRRS